MAPSTAFWLGRRAGWCPSERKPSSASSESSSGPFLASEDSDDGPMYGLRGTRRLDTPQLTRTRCPSKRAQCSRAEKVDLQVPLLRSVGGVRRARVGRKPTGSCWLALHAAPRGRFFSCLTTLHIDTVCAHSLVTSRRSMVCRLGLSARFRRRGFGFSFQSYKVRRFYLNCLGLPRKWSHGLGNSS